MTNQKNWIDLLGRNTDYVHVDGNRIVRGFEELDDDGSLRFEVLWTFDTPEQAKENFEAWLHEVIKDANMPPIGTVAYTAFMMAQLCPPEEEGLPNDFWDNWKEEMKERNMP